MMARSQARRAGLNKNLGDVTNKENVSMSGNTRSRLKQINSMYSGESFNLIEQAGMKVQKSLKI